MNLIRTIGENLLRERDRWLLWAPVAIGAGIVAYFLWPSEPPLWALAATPLFAAAAWLARAHFSVALAISVLLLAALGFNAAQVETKIVEAPMLDRQIGPAPVTGKLVFTEVMPDGVRLTLEHP